MPSTPQKTLTPQIVRVPSRGVDSPKRESISPELSSLLSRDDPKINTNYPNNNNLRNFPNDNMIRPSRPKRRSGPSNENTGRRIASVDNTMKNNMILEELGDEKDLDIKPKLSFMHYIPVRAIQASIKSVVESRYTVGLMCALTIWSLFSDDIRVLAVPKSHDSIIQGITSATFVVYLLEIILISSYNQSYFHPPKLETLSTSITSFLIELLHMVSFYFVLDFIATFTLIIEIHWVIGMNMVSMADMLSHAGLLISRASVVLRISRFCRMLRLLRMSKLYKYITVYYKDIEDVMPLVPTKLVTMMSPVSSKSDDAFKRLRKDKESHVGAAMSDLTNRRVIVLIFTMLLLIPLFFVFDEDTTPIISTSLLQKIGYLNSTNPGNYTDTLQVVIQNIIQIPSVLGINLDGRWVVLDEARIEKLRYEEIARYTANENTGYYAQTMFDFRQESVRAARFGIYVTLFVAALLSLSTLSFTTEVNRLVIIPIDRMVALVKKISANPLGVEYKVLGEKDGFLEGMETTILLTTITKIGGLMRVGFGEAGASIIARNLADSAGGKLNLMGAGTMIQSIFGFCDIRQFTDTTECLQEEVMLFVNRIAHILHGIVVQCSGSANKNIGDAFLLTWKIDENQPQNETRLADQALLSFSKSLIELSRHQNFICDFSAGATSRLFTRFPGYKVKIGFGLHRGWAIEGAIGSNRKIDASYLSPHVSFTEFLESSTKKYGVSMLLSEPFYRILSPNLQRFCREIDRVRRKEDIHGNTDVIMGLYTYDVDTEINWENIDHRRKMHTFRRQGLMRRTSKKNLSERRLNIGNRLRLNSRGESLSPEKRARVLPIAMDIENSLPVNDATSGDKSKEAPDIKIPPYHVNIWIFDEDLVDQRRHIDEAFLEKWEKGFRAFIEGDWEKSRAKLEDTCILCMNNDGRDPDDLRISTVGKDQVRDGPSVRLLKFMSERGNQPPADWAGFSYDC